MRFGESNLSAVRDEATNPGHHDAGPLKNL